jgi:AraC-like DNA-binding protein
MRYYRPLLLQRLALRVPGVEVLKLRLHRHLATVDQVQLHSHDFGQVLLYLGGHGQVELNGQLWQAREGTVFWIPPKVVHGFREESGRRPLCLVLDVRLRGPAYRNWTTGVCTQTDLGKVRTWMAELAPLHHQAETVSALRVSGLVLELLDLLLQRLGRIETRSRTGSSPVLQSIQRWLQKNGWHGFSRARLAKDLGYQADHLNRLVKQASGLTFGQWENQVRLAQAREALTRKNSVGEASLAVGFSEQNYFARWFRRQTGQSPTQFRRG